MTDRGRPREFDREKALQQAMLLFWSKGFSATSISDLCEAMGIRSPSLYAAFGSKEALYLETIEHNAKTVGLPLVWGRLAEAPTARDGVKNLLLAAAEGLTGNGVYPPGCMLTLASMGESCPGAIPDALKALRTELLAMLRSRFNDAVRAGELAPNADTDDLARFFLAAYQGISTQARDGATTQELMGITTLAMSAWPLAGTRKERRRRVHGHTHPADS